MRPRILLTLLLLSAIYLSTGAQSLPGKKIPSTALLSDLAVLRSGVVALHPGLGRFGPREEFVHSLDSVQAVVAKRDSIDFLSFFRMVNPVLGKLRCGHVKFFPPMKSFPFYFFTDNLVPLIVRFDATGQLLVTHASDPKAVGLYLKSINGASIDAVLHTLRRQMFVDGHVRSSADAQIQQYFSAWYADFVQDETGPFSLGLVDENGKRISLILPGITHEAWRSINVPDSYLSADNGISFPSDTVARLRIAHFYSSEGDRHFRAFLDSAFEQVFVRPVRHLIIDVRGNEGGNDALGKYLYAYIAQRDFRYYDYIEVKMKRKKDVPYRGNVYLPRFIGLARLFIKKDDQGRLLFKKHQNLGLHHPRRKAYTGRVSFLMDGLSYSVTSEFLAVARSERRGAFIGEESGGAYEGDNSGTFAIYKLPLTGLDLGIPLAKYSSAVEAVPTPGRGVMPDIEIKPSRQDLLADRDPAGVVLSN